MERGVDPDQALVAAAQAGDAEAVNALVRRHQARIFNFALALTAVSLVATGMFALYLDRGRIITGAAPAGRAASMAPASNP